MKDATRQILAIHRTSREKRAAIDVDHGAIQSGELKDSTRQILADSRAHHKKHGLPTAADRRAMRDNKKPRKPVWPWFIVAVLAFFFWPAAIVLAVVLAIQK